MDYEEENKDLVKKTRLDCVFKLLVPGIFHSFIKSTLIGRFWPSSCSLCSGKGSMLTVGLQSSYFSFNLIYNSNGLYISSSIDLFLRVVRGYFVKREKAVFIFVKCENAIF